jgi:hypothetical protein
MSITSSWALTVLFGTIALHEEYYFFLFVNGPSPMFLTQTVACTDKSNVASDASVPRHRSRSNMILFFFLSTQDFKTLLDREACPNALVWPFLVNSAARRSNIQSTNLISDWKLLPFGTLLHSPFLE